MDTKYQSKVFSGILLLAAIICMALTLITCFEKRIDLQENTLSYFHNSPEIHDMTLRYVKNLQRYFVYYKNFDIDAATEKLSEIDKFISTGKIEPKQNDYSVNLQPFINEDKGDDNIQNDDEKIENLRPESFYDFNIDNVTVDVLLDYQAKLSDAISNYNSVKDYINNNDDFHFILYDNGYGHIIATNSDGFYNEECYESIDITDPMFNTTFNGESLINSFKDQGLSCEISIPITTSNDVKILMNLLHRQLSNNKIFSSKIVSTVLFGIAMLLLLFIFLYDKSFLSESNKKIYNVYAKVPMVVLVPIMCVIVETLIYSFKNNRSMITELTIYGNGLKIAFIILSSIFAVIFSFLFAEHIFMLIKDRQRIIKLPDIQFVSMGVSDCKLAYGAGKIFFALCMSVMLLIIVGLACILFLMMLNFYMFMPYIIIVTILIFILVILYNGCAAEVKLRYYILQMVNGHMDVVPVQKGLFTNSINQLNGIRENFQQNLNETLRSERLKTDLITNVSHDLKTPLTSIISYVDLLSALPDNSEQAKEYIEIVKNKSKRLKTLIDDLFEASKLSSGQMKLQYIKSDIVSLLEQTLGELSYKIENAGIEFVVTKSTQPIIVNMDGERMWRVFDNLINNILKYSPRGSRAYIEIADKVNKVTITFKNVANYHMEFNADELFERFKRGDSARTTEGSGLGLSIAKNIVELHNGTMNIVTDGDLFKIIVELSKINEEVDENKE